MNTTCQGNLSLCHCRHAFHKVTSLGISQIVLNQKSLCNFQKWCKFSTFIKLRKGNCIKRGLPLVIIYNIPFLWLLRVVMTVYVYNQSRTVHAEWTDQNCWNIALWVGKISFHFNIMADSCHDVIYIHCFIHVPKRVPLTKVVNCS